MDILRLKKNCPIGLLLLGINLILSTSVLAVLAGEEDGSPNHTSTACWAFKFANDNVTQNADGTCSIADQTGVGAGDVASVGDCASGACLDGTSDGGSWIALYDGDSNLANIDTANLNTNRSYELPNESGTFCTTGSVCSGYESSTSNDIDPDRLNGDSTDDNLVDSSIVEQNAGTDINADLEEETHASEHNDGGADEITSINADNLSAGTVPAARVGADHIDAITEIAAALKDGSGECGSGLICLGGHTHPGGSDTNSIKEYYWPAAATLPLEAADSIATIIKDVGTNSDLLVAAFNDSTDECRFVTFKVPTDVDTSGNSVTFRVKWYAQTGSVSNAVWDARWHEVADGEVWDGSLTTDAASVCAAASATQNTVDECTWTETFANLGWVAQDDLQLQICRDANNASDNLSDDAYMISFAVEMPRA